MKKEYKRPSVEVVKIEQVLLSITSPHDEYSGNDSYAPGMKRGRGRYAEDDFDDEEEEDL